MRGAFWRQLNSYAVLVIYRGMDKVMKRIDTIKKCEFSTGMEMHDGVLDAPDDHPFFTGFNRNTHYLVWPQGRLPELFAYTNDEIAERNQSDERERFKATRAEAVANIRVTVNGNEFDGDEVAQARMLSAINAATVLGSPVIPLWVLANNSVVKDLLVDDLRQAHALAVVAMAQVWLPTVE